MRVSGTTGKGRVGRRKGSAERESRDQGGEGGGGEIGHEKGEK